MCYLKYCDSKKKIKSNHPLFTQITEEFSNVRMLLYVDSLTAAEEQHCNIK